VRTRFVRGLLLAALALVLAACTGGGPQDTFDPAGPVAQKQKDILIPILWVAAAVFVVVEGGIVLIALKYRHRKGRDRIPAQTHGNTRLEIGWTIAPAVVLAFVMVPTISLIWELAERPPDAMQITVKGYQWWWGFEYTDEDMQVDYAEAPIVTADVMVVPEDTVIDLTIVAEGGGARSEDGEPDHQVIHSFWVPRLFGKQDLVPGHESHIVFSADETGTYWAQCAEFCGLQHGTMRFRVRVLNAADWEAWVANQKQPAEAPTEGLAQQGMDLFLNGEFNGGRCVDCHGVGGLGEGGGTAAPDLTHFAAPEHECFAGCMWETSDEEALKDWIRDPNAVKLGAKMPDYDLTEDEIDAITAFLMSLT
jgi:cytochrome c oxidase subunit II